MSVTQQDLIEFSRILPKRTNERYAVAREHPTRYISRLVFRNYGKIGQFKYFDTTEEVAPDKYKEMNESDIYKNVISPDIDIAKQHKAYKQCFSNGSIRESVIGFLREFPLFSNADFDRPEKYPFTEYHIVDIYCSLSYLFAEYMADIERYESSKVNKHKDDYIRLLSEVDKSCQTLRERLSTDAVLSLELYEAVDIAGLDRLQDEISNRKKELRLIGRNGDELPERILMLRLGYNLLSISTGGKAPLVDSFWTYANPDMLVAISKYETYFQVIGDNLERTGVDQFQSVTLENDLNGHKLNVTETRMHKWCMGFCADQGRELNPSMAKNCLRNKLKDLFVEARAKNQ